MPLGLPQAFFGGDFMEANWGSWPPKGWVFYQILEFFGQILELFLKMDIFLTNLVKIEQEITLFLPKNWKFVNKNDLKRCDLKEKQKFYYKISWVFQLQFETASDGLSFLPKLGLEFFCGWPWVFWKRTKKMPDLHTLWFPEKCPNDKPGLADRIR